MVQHDTYYDKWFTTARTHTHTPCARNSSLNSASSPEWNSEPYSFWACCVTCVSCFCATQIWVAASRHLTRQSPSTWRTCRLCVPLCIVRVRIVCACFLCGVYTPARARTRTGAHTRIMLYTPTIMIISVSVFTWITWASSWSCSWGSSSKSGPMGFSPQMFLYFLPRYCDEFHWFSTTLSK